MTREVKNIIWMIWKNDQGESFKVGELSKGLKNIILNMTLKVLKRLKNMDFLHCQIFLE